MQKLLMNYKNLHLVPKPKQGENIMNEIKRTLNRSFPTGGKAKGIPS